MQLLYICNLNEKTFDFYITLMSHELLYVSAPRS